MRKPVYLAILGISIAVAAASLGVTVTRYLGLRAYSPKEMAQASVPPAGPNVPATPPEQWNNLFAPGDGMKMASRLPTMSGKTASQAPRTRFVLVGTIVSSAPSYSRAILWANGMKEPKAFREKEEVEPGAFLASVERDKAWITRGNEREKLEILPVGSPERATATAAPTVAPPVAAEASLPAVPAGTSALPGVAPATRPTPVTTQAVGASNPSMDPEDQESARPQERGRRSRGIRR
ncbi:MAG TPA: type II secretion system protein N [Candidatus Deferrimicrobium sp.]